MKEFRLSDALVRARKYYNMPYLVDVRLFYGIYQQLVYTKETGEQTMGELSKLQEENAELRNTGVIFVPDKAELVKSKLRFYVTDIHLDTEGKFGTKYNLNIELYDDIPAKYELETDENGKPLSGLSEAMILSMPATPYRDNVYQGLMAALGEQVLDAEHKAPTKKYGPVRLRKSGKAMELEDLEESEVIDNS